MPSGLIAGTEAALCAHDVRSSCLFVLSSSTLFFVYVVFMMRIVFFPKQDLWGFCQAFLRGIFVNG